MTEIADIITSAMTAVTTLGILPYVLAGAVIAVAGRLLLAAKKGSR